ncbi:unnamed protein product [Ixodes pacificus]
MISKRENSLLQRVAKTGKKESRVPFWFMRQAGRYLPEYHEVMQKSDGFMQACYNPKIVKEITLQPIKRLDVDAAIIFSDIMVIPDAMGYEIEFIKGKGPRVRELRENRILPVEESIERLEPVFHGIREVRQSLDEKKSLIGFAGSPWTVATYILGKEKNFSAARKEAYTNSKRFKELIEKITELTAIYLVKQIDQGADIIQIFDSNSGLLPPNLFSNFVIEPTRKIVSSIKKTHPDTPIIGFPRGGGVMYKEFSDKTSVDVTSIDYSTPITWAKENVRGVLQGNLDPFVLAYDCKEAIERAKRIIEDCRETPLIFNLGHGIIPETPVENVEKLAKYLKSI